MVEPHVVTLRGTRDDDLDAVFGFRRDAESLRMAAFVTAHPDRAAFDACWATLLADPDVDVRTIRADGVVVGDLGCWTDDGRTFVGYWIDRSNWSRGIATRALQLFLDAVRERPVHAYVAADNAGSIAVLNKLGFRRVRSERSFADARGEEVEKYLYRLE